MANLMRQGSFSRRAIIFCVVIILLAVTNAVNHLATKETVKEQVEQQIQFDKNGNIVAIKTGSDKTTTKQIQKTYSITVNGFKKISDKDLGYLIEVCASMRFFGSQFKGNGCIIQDLNGITSFGTGITVEF
jgi:uncharacterized membrane protein YdfJ with MMPL/SSD domain